MGTNTEISSQVLKGYAQESRLFVSFLFVWFWRRLSSYYSTCWPLSPPPRTRRLRCRSHRITNTHSVCKFPINVTVPGLGLS